MERLKRDYPDKFDYELVAWCEIDKAACMAHDALFPQWKDRNLGDISKVKAEDIPDCDCMTWSFPCTDISGAGKQMGLSKNSGTRSSLCWEAIRCFKAKRPKYLLMENVVALAQRRFIKDFHALQHELEQMGYTNFCAILDSAKFGVPQHRERLFMVSILNCTQSYHFPEPFNLEKRIKDILEPYGTVDESFYFKPEQLLRIIAHCDRKVEEGCGFKTQFHTEDEISGCVTTRYGQRETDPCIKESVLFNPMDDGTARTIKSQYARVGPANCIRQDGFGASCVIEPALQQRLSLYGNNAQAGRVYDVDGIAPCLDTCCGGNRMPKILTPVRTEEAKELRIKGIEVFKHRELVPREDGVSNTITTVLKDNLLQEPCILGYTRDKKGNIVNYHDKDVANTVHTFTGGGWNTDQFVKEPVAVAMRGRNPDNPSDRTKGAPTEQRLEFGDNIANCITTVQKDSMVAEPMVGNDPRSIFCKDDFRSDVCGALMAVDYNAPKLVKEPIELSFDNLPDKTVLKDEDGKGYLWQDGSLWRVRKLHPIETSRLMDVADEDFYKMQDAGISKSALYGLFGNSIVVSVLYHIFRKLWIETENESAQKSLFDF